jgi:hypothetical protein
MASVGKLTVKLSVEDFEEAAKHAEENIRETYDLLDEVIVDLRERDIGFSPHLSERLIEWHEKNGKNKG